MKTKKRVAIIGTVGLPANYGGFETLTSHLVENLSNEYNMTVYCSAKRYPIEERKSNYKGAKLEYINLNANGIQSILYDTISILKALFYHDTLLILGVAGAWILPFVRLFTRKKIIISIDGIEWKREKWNIVARLYLRWAEKMAVRYSHADIADNESIQDYTAMRYGSVSRVIEYGADHTRKVTANSEDIENYPFLKEKYAFKVCRIEPENNIHLVLSAFSSLPHHRLVMVGNWETSTYGKELKQKYATVENIILFDPIYHQRTLDLLRTNAAVYVHGHSAGGTNPSLVEAMYLGLPIIAYGVSYNRTTTQNEAVYFTDEQDLISALEMTSSFSLKKVGERMETIAKTRYTWKLIASKYANLFSTVHDLSYKQRIHAQLEGLDTSFMEELEISHLKNTKLIFES